MDDRHLHELPADGDDRIQAAHRILVDHRQAAAAQLPEFRLRHLRHVAAFEQDAAAGEPPGAAEITHDRERDRRLAAAGLADQSDRLALRQLEADAGNDVDLAGAREIGDAGVVELEDGRAGYDRFRHDPSQSRMLISRRPSASRLKPTTSEESAIAGARAMRTWPPMTYP